MLIRSATSLRNGYDEMVKVLAQGWAQESATIAREISRLP